MTFRFRAAPLLAIRARQLEAAQAQLARAHEAARAADALLGAAKHAAAASIARYGDALDRGSDHAELQRHRTWIGHQRAQLETRERTRATCGQLVAAASAATVAAHRQLRVLERLRDRLHRRHDTGVRRREMNEIDQLATLQHARRGTEQERHDD